MVMCFYLVSILFCPVRCRVIPSFQWLFGSLWDAVTVRVLFMGQIDLYANYLFYIEILEINKWIQVYVITLSCHQHRYPWPSLATPRYRSSLMAGPQGYIPYPHRAAVCRFELVALLLLGHVKGSIGEHHLWARPCFSSSILHAWFIKLW